MQWLDFIGTSEEQYILSSEHIRSMQCLGEQESLFIYSPKSGKYKYTKLHFNTLLKLVIISYLVGVDQVDVSGSVYDEVDLCA